MKKIKRSARNESRAQHSPKKIKMDNESTNSNLKLVEKYQKNKIERKKEETSDSDETNTDKSNSDNESDINKKNDISKKKLDFDTSDSASENSSDPNGGNELDKLVKTLQLRKKKKMQSVATLVSLSLPSKEELKYRRKKKDSEEEINYFKMFTCTKCNFSFEKSIKKNKEISIHPLLGVLMCSKCCNYYGDGDFSLDSDDEDKYCRWCGEGGTIFSCSQCICGFCKRCIQKHFGKKIAINIENEDDWLCYFCNTKPLWELRYICSLAQEKCKELQENEKHTLLSNIKIKRILNKEGDRSPEKLSTSGNMEHCEYQMSSTSDESDNENKLSKQIMSTPKKTSSNDVSNYSSYFNSKKLKIIKELENILKLTEYQMSFGSKWSSKKLITLSKLEHVKSESSLKKECQKIKWFISILCSYLVGFTSSIDSIEKSLDEEVSPVKEKISTTDPAYNSILKFLNFTSHLVKTFDRKNIDLEYLLNSKLYEDDNVLGLQKKPKSSSTKEETEDYNFSELEESPKPPSNDKQPDIYKTNDPVEKNLELLFDTSGEENHRSDEE